MSGSNSSSFISTRMVTTPGAPGSVINPTTEMKKLFVAVTIACLGTIVISTGAQTPSPSPDASASEEGVAEGTTDRAERCDCPASPDGKFAFVQSFGEQDSSADPLQIIDLIEKKSGKKLQRIDDASMPVSWNVLWAPDSNGFVLTTKVVGHPKLEDAVAYFRSGETFKKIELPESHAYWSRAVWAPDLKRFAFNLGFRNGPLGEAVALYQLRDNKWVALQSPVDEASEHSQLEQLARKYSAKNSYRKPDSSSVNDVLEARRWTDANTLILYAYSATEDSETGALFTLKFDETGKWKIVKMHRMSEKELKNELKEE